MRLIAYEEQVWRVNEVGFGDVRQVWWFFHVGAALPPVRANR